jgi:Cu+-exporting ATPase
MVVSAVSEDNLKVEAAGSSSELAVAGMTCANCARKVSEAIRGVAGVAGVTTRVEEARATVRWTGAADVAGVIAAVKKAGYEAKPLAQASAGTVAHEGGKSEWSPLAGWRFNVVAGLLCTVPLIAGEWIFRLMGSPWFNWLSFALASMVQIGCGARFYAGAWRQLKAGHSNMDTLVALGSTTAFGYSVWALLSGMGGHLYFMESAAIITLISVGHWVEARTGEKAESSLRALMHLAPATARRVAVDGVETETPVAALLAGDMVRLRPGDHVPVDGVVREGESAVDESMLTGESSPVDKKAGATLYAGTMNLNGAMVMRVTETGEATALAQIIAAVERAQSSRAEIQRLGDRVSSVFVPVVVLVAVATGLWWGLCFDQAHRLSMALAAHLWPAMMTDGALAAAFIHAAAVLIIACPCAMGLATPAAIMAGTNAAARRGILVRDGVAFERAGRITAMVFDKTGTLTMGRPEVVEVLELKIQNSKFKTEEVAEGDVRREAAGGIQNGDNGAGRQEAGDRMEGTTSPQPFPPRKRGGERVLEPVPGGLRPAGVGPGLSATTDLIRGGWKAATSEGANVRQIAAALARRSGHPISQAVAKLAEGDPGLTKWEELRGLGVQARIGTAVVRLGSVRWLRECGVDLRRGAEFEAKWSAEGATVLGVASDGALLGMLALRDTLKPGAAGVVKQLRGQGLEIYLVTGDNALTSKAIARQVGIAEANVFAETRPERKAGIIGELRGRGARVAFVGDGINDAPALEAADLGIAVSRASDVARAAADVILLKSEIEAVPEALGLARVALRTIKQNLFWAFFYNVAGIPLAALGLMSPVLCALAMGLSDLVVIGNALRLLRWRPPMPSETTK